MPANKKLTPLQILYKEFKNAKTDAARNEAWRNFEIKRSEMYPARTDRKHAVIDMNDAATKKAFEDYLSLVPGGENHRYYNPGSGRSVGARTKRQRSPEVFYDEETGEPYVRAFHYTQPENIDNILRTGLAERLGPDAVNFQRRAGVWTSFGPENPMNYDFVNRAYLGEKKYSMEPLEIRIPAEEWRAMNVDHTGRTGNDEVMVFRGSPAKPYGTTEINGQQNTVVIPPEYIRRYEFPKDWETETVTGKRTLWGYRPNKSEAHTSAESFWSIIPNHLKKQAEEAVGMNKNPNEYLQWLIDNRQNEVKESFETSRGLAFNESTIGSYWKTFFNSDLPYIQDALKNPSVKIGAKESVIAENLEKEANKAWLNGTNFENAYELAKGVEKPPFKPEGYFARGYPRVQRNVTSTDFREDEMKRTNRLLTDMAGDRMSIGDLANESYLTDITNNPQMSHYGIEWTSRVPTGKYLEQAGVREEFTKPWFNDLHSPIHDEIRNHYNKRDEVERYALDRRSNRYKLGHIDEDLYKNKFAKRFNELDKAADLDPENADLDAMKKVFVDFNAEKHTPEQMKAAREYVFGTPDKYGRSKFGQKDIGTAKMHARNAAALSDEFISKVASDALKMSEEHPDRSITDLEGIATKSEENQNLLDRLAEENYDEALQNIMENKRKSWRRQFTQDSLNRVYGHELGRKIGKYRASRGKPVNPKQL